MPVATDVLQLIGHTPIVKVTHLDSGPCDLFLKLENQNPSGSIKDRIALAMIEAAEQSGLLSRGQTLVEATSGNTGIALALVANLKGYKLIFILPDKTSQEKIFHLTALGAQVIITRSDVCKGHPDYYHDMAQRIAHERGYYYINQFENLHNPAAHERTTGPELWAQMEQNLDAIVVGAGTGGTLTGLGRYFAGVQPQLEMVLADPQGSVLAPTFRNEPISTNIKTVIEGIGKDFVPKTCDLSWVKHAYSITDYESITTAQDVLRHEGILCGPSSGALIATALRYCRAQPTKKRVVTFVCDSGNKYLSKVYNPQWLTAHGFA